MNGATILFYLLAILIIGSGILAVTSQQIFRSAIYLLFSLIGIAGLYFWMQYEFIAAVQIVVYVGGIIVLIIFSIFLTQQAGQKMPSPTINKKIIAAIASLVLFILMIIQILKYQFIATTSTTILTPTVNNIGTQMLGVDEGGFSLLFEVISILLLAALIGCIVIAMPSNKIEENN